MDKVIISPYKEITSQMESNSIWFIVTIFAGIYALGGIYAEVHDNILLATSFYKRSLFILIMALIVDVLDYLAKKKKGRDIPPEPLVTSPVPKS